MNLEDENEFFKKEQSFRALKIVRLAVIVGVVKASYKMGLRRIDYAKI